MKQFLSDVFPKWMQEFHRFQTLKSQFYLYGNIYDCFYFPINHTTATNPDELEWRNFVSISQLLELYLKNEGYKIRIYYDFVDGFEIRSEVSGIEKESIVDFLRDNNPAAKEHFKDIDLNTISRNLENTLFMFRYLVSNNEHLSAGIINFASRFTSRPNELDMSERCIFVNLIKAAQEAKIFINKERKRNILVFICDKLCDIPSWVLLENPLTKGIEIQRPNLDERRRFFNVQSPLFYHEGKPIDHDTVLSVFSDLTDGLTNRELENLLTISNQEKIHVNNIREIVDLFKYGTKENFWEKLDKKKIDQAEITLKKRVLGQDKAVKKAVDVIRRAYLGLHTIDHSKPKNKPKGVLFFAGPTGVGKTELARALAELIYNDENAIIRFDMSEYNDSNSDVKLIGSPPGYVGYEEGGQLTSQVKSRPFSIILFDEIEKAHPVVFDKFLQILDDGRLTDGKGDTVYFSESLIIFTSNLGVFKETQDGKRVENIKYGDSPEEIQKNIKREIEQFFNKKLNRPEILNRFGNNFVVFDFIRPDTDKKILLKSLKTIQANMQKHKNCTFDFDDEFVESFRTHYLEGNLINGGRGINNQVETYVKDGIANFLYENNKIEGFKFKIYINKTDNKVAFKCIGN